MRKKIYLFFVLLLIIASVCSCQFKANSQDSDLILNMENRLSALESENTLYKSKLEELLQKNSVSETLDPSPTTSDTSSEESTTEPQQKGYTYSVSNGVATITGYVGNEKALVIPASIDGYRIVSIGDHAFEDSSLVSVIISDGVESIGWFAFNGCVKLKEITVPASVTSIGYSAFGAADSKTNILCHSDSFVLQYAKSFGLSYTVI